MTDVTVLARMGKTAIRTKTVIEKREKGRKNEEKQERKIATEVIVAIERRNVRRIETEIAIEKEKESAVAMEKTEKRTKSASRSGTETESANVIATVIEKKTEHVIITAREKKTAMWIRKTEVARVTERKKRHTAMETATVIKIKASGTAKTTKTVVTGTERKIGIETKRKKETTESVVVKFAMTMIMTTLHVKKSGWTINRHLDVLRIHRQDRTVLLQKLCKPYEVIMNANAKFLLL